MKIKVYIFDDDEFIRRMLHAVLTEAGFEAVCFADPVGICNNLRVCRSPEQADLIITDIHMPVISGIMLAEKLIAAGFDKENILVISGTHRDLYGPRMKQLGLYTLGKPFRLDNLVNWLEERKCRIQNNCLIMEWDDG